MRLYYRGNKEMVGVKNPAARFLEAAREADDDKRLCDLDMFLVIALVICGEAARDIARNPSEGKPFKECLLELVQQRVREDEGNV